VDVAFRLDNVGFRAATRSSAKGRNIWDKDSNGSSPPKNDRARDWRWQPRNKFLDPPFSLLLFFCYCLAYVYQKT